MLTYLEREKNVGDAINLTIFRDGKPAEINLTLAARPDSGQQALLQKEETFTWNFWDKHYPRYCKSNEFDSDKRGIPCSRYH